jgi:hypothetical protein
MDRCTLRLYSLGALLATKTLTSYLFGITPSDPSTFALVTLVFLLVAFLACYLPARDEGEPHCGPEVRVMVGFR